MSRDEELLFAEESSTITPPKKRQWKVVIADDEEEVHAVTRMVLDGFTFEKRGLELLGAYSGKETKALLQKHPDTALLLLDVVMEEDTTGLEVVRYIRDELNNRFVRIIMRTGQPGQAPERRVTMEYDINDYREKTELTAQKLFTTVIASLRAYRDLRTIEKNRKGLEQIVATSARLFEIRSLQQFATGVLTQLTSLLDLDDDQLPGKSSGFVLKKQQDHYTFLTGIGVKADSVTDALHSVLTPDVKMLLQQAVEHQRSLFSHNTYIGYVQTRDQIEYLLCLKSQYPLSEIETNLIRIFSTNIAVAFDNLALAQEIEESQREVIFTLGEVVETRSEEIGYHVKRVGEYCYLLAKKFGLGEKLAELLRLASPMHDVGKIGIPDAILNKPGELDDDEFEIIKTHTTIGHDILKGSKQDILKTAAIIALQHHERWDGTGYPHHLRGEHINVLARIVKVADVFDALSCKRVYKDAWELERILKTLKKDKGTHFDPILVELLLDNLDEFLQIRNRFRDDC